MNANELRIGNWVSNIHDIPMIVKAIYEDTIYVDFKGNVGALWEFNKYEPFKPIELTEEILLKCGFRKENNVIPIYTLDLISIYWNSEYYPNGRLYFNSWCIHKEKTKYLHQLQNLYWCLCGKELEIEL